MLGVGDFINDVQPFTAPYSQSVYIPDYVINPHPRFAALTQNIRCRRGSKVNIKVPLFRDTNTPEFSTGKKSQLHSGIIEEDTDIHMDCQAFGMGMCCLVSVATCRLIVSDTVSSASDFPSHQCG